MEQLALAHTEDPSTQWLLPSLAAVALGAVVIFAVSAGDEERTPEVSRNAEIASERAESAKPVDVAEDLALELKTDSEDATNPIGEPESEFDGLKEVDDLIAKKKMTQAIRSLDRLRRANPGSAYLAFLQGTLYMERSYWQDGFAAYRSAIAKDARYREHALKQIQAGTSSKLPA